MGLDNLCAWKKGLIFGMIVTLIFIAIEIAEKEMEEEEVEYGIHFVK